jgi:desulfoferrodoxin (superoxide reductase-like protein)
MKKMAPGRLLVILVSALFVLSLPHLALAHNPQSVEVSYDYKTQTLAVKITHTSNNPDRHFVKEVDVKKNGQVVQRGVYSKQSGDTFVYTYKVAATGADTIEVTAFCSIHGSTTQKFNPGV